MIIQYLDLSAAAVIAKITTALFPVVFNDSRLKLYFQPASESPKTVSLSCTKGRWEDGIQLEVV